MAPRTGIPALLSLDDREPQCNKETFEFWKRPVVRRGDRGQLPALCFPSVQHIVTVLRGPGLHQHAGDTISRTLTGAVMPDISAIVPARRSPFGGVRSLRLWPSGFLDFAH